MTLRALKLIARVLSLKTPPRSLVYSARNKINLWLGNGDRRFEFEKRYLEHGDVWNYETSDYERDKYSRTLDFIRSARRGNASVLEVGCSVGVFTELLAAEFERESAHNRMCREGSNGRPGFREERTMPPVMGRRLHRPHHLCRLSGDGHPPLPL